jgi:hypothetical protein
MRWVGHTGGIDALRTCEQLRFGSYFVCNGMGTCLLLFVPESDSGRTGENYRLVIWNCG